MRHLYQRRVQFADTDAAGVVHFAQILCYAEEAEHDLLSKLNIPLLGNGGWPRVAVNCDYRSPLKMGDVCDVVLSADEVGKSSINWRFSVEQAGRLVAEGKMASVRVDRMGKPDGLCDDWREALSAYIS